MNFQRFWILSKLLRRDHFHAGNVGQEVKFYSYCNPQSKIVVKLPYKKFAQFHDFPQKCWQCEYPHKSKLFCSKCKALQKLPENLNYFDIIGVEKNFDVSIEDMQKKYRQLQSLLHPDKYGQKSEREKEISENLSSLINKAYTTLTHPLDRGLYMLKLENITIPEETTNLDPEFLMEIMEKNEEVEEASADTQKTLHLMEENRKILAELTRQISKAFFHKDTDEAKKLLIRMKYYISIETRLKKIKQDLGIVE